MKALAFAAGLVLMPGLAAAQLACAELRFAAGASSGVVSGNTPVVGEACYRIGVSPGQRVRVDLESYGNVQIGINGRFTLLNVIEFTTQARAYEIWVSKISNGPGGDPYRLQVTIR